MTSPGMWKFISTRSNLRPGSQRGASHMMNAIVLIHVAISLIAIVTGIIVMFRMIGASSVPALTTTFLVTTILTNATGFIIPPFLYDKFLPSHAIGILSLVLLAIACFAQI